MGLMETTATAQEINRFGLKVDDVAITKDSEDWSDIGVPALVVESKSDLVCGYHLAIIRPQRLALVGSFLLRTLQADAVNRQFQVAATGVTRYGLPKSAIGEAWLLLPPQQEQRAIADFLDRETEKIDTLVVKKRTLIERLKEERTALITHTVTRGLPPEAARAAGIEPHPKFKPSGVEWLGDVPEHWRISRLSRLTSCLDGRRIPLNREERSDRQGPYPYWGANGIVDHIDDWLFDESLVLLGEDGAPFFAKNKEVAFHVTGKIWVNNHAHVLRPQERNDCRFLAAALNQTEFDMFIDGSTRDKLTQDKMQAIPLAIPSPIEQHAIADFLDRETEKIDTLVTKIEIAIERLQEYRSALITATVTGKIDAREEAAL